MLMMPEDFKPGVKVRIGKGFDCMEEGSIKPIEDDGQGNPCIRCSPGGMFSGRHYLPMLRTDDGHLREIFLAD